MTTISRARRALGAAASIPNIPTALIALLGLGAVATGCVGPDIDYGEVRTFEVERLEEGPYLIAAGDGLSIQFLYHPERNAAVQVRTDGKFSMPFAEEVQA